MSFGNLYSQTTFYASLKLDYKLSFTDTYLGDIKLQDDTRFEHIHVYAPKMSFKKPYKLGFGFGVKHKRHGVHFDHQPDHVSSEMLVYLKLPSTGNDDSYTVVGGYTRAQQNKWSINYDFYCLNKEKKTNLFVSSFFSLIYRAGPKGVGPAGAMHNSGMLGQNVGYQSSSSSFTADAKYGFGFGFGLGSDIHFKGYYLFTLSSNYMFSNSYLSFTNQNYTYFDHSMVRKHEMTQYHTSNAFYLSISRKFQILPWKPIKSHPIVKFFKENLDADKATREEIKDQN